MTSLTLVHPERTFTIPVLQAIDKCRLFKNNPTLTALPYLVQSSVPLPIFQQFLSAFDGTPITITSSNFHGLQKLTKEFGFADISVALSTFPQSSPDPSVQHLSGALSRFRDAQLPDSFAFIVNGIRIETDFSESVAHFPAVREQLSVDGCARTFTFEDRKIQSNDIHSLQFLLSGAPISLRRSHVLLTHLLGNVPLEQLFFGFANAQIELNLSDLMAERRIELESVDASALSIDALDNLLLSQSFSIESEDALLHFILNLDSGYRNLLRHVQFGFLSAESFSLFSGIPPEPIWIWAAELITNTALPRNWFNSRIISGFPDIFAEFQGKRIVLLWRGSRDGFGASEFHARCDGHANTLTVVLAKKRNVFGAFTPVEWESREWNGKSDDSDSCLKADESLRSFLFTLKNPHKVAPRKFALKEGMKHRAIRCDWQWGPFFGDDIAIFNNCNTNNASAAYLGSAFVNDTGLEPGRFFMGSKKFQVKDIEVFEILD